MASTELTGPRNPDPAKIKLFRLSIQARFVYTLFIQLMKKRIYYFHGFKSAGGGSKYEILRKVYGQEYQIHSPTLGNNVYEVRRELRQIGNALEASDDYSLVIGTSMGGFYARYFAAVIHYCPIILVNPVLKPSDHMAKYLGTQRNFKSGDAFEFTREDLQLLKQMEDEIRDSLYSGHFHHLVALGKQDELVDVQAVADMFEHRPTVKFYNDDHRFNDKFEEMLREERTRNFIDSPWVDHSDFQIDPVG